jgi:MoaA/NifB/PqqE/SkfB family radical SAM enzyme
MDVEINDKSLMMIFLLEECNLACPHCVREDEPMDHGYKLSFQQLLRCLSDCRKLEAVTWVHFSGGEPTLWSEEGRHLVDLLLAISDAGFTPGFTTNGSAFVDHDGFEALIGRYLALSDRPLRLYLSIDTFHGNFDGETGRAVSLDNVLSCRHKLPRDKAQLLQVSILVVVSKQVSSLLPPEMVSHYESMGARFVFVPLAPHGRAKTMRHLCPVLDSDNPEDLGAYARFCESERRDGSVLGGKGNRALHIILVGDEYYVSLEAETDFGGRWQRIGRLGALPDTIIRHYSVQHHDLPEEG